MACSKGQMHSPSQKESSTASSKRPKTLFQQRMAAFDAAEREAATWQYRAKNVLVHIAITYGLALYLLFAIPFPTLVPTDLEALELLVLGAVPLAAYFLIGLLVEEWLKERIEHYWFWRITATTIFISVGAGLIYGMFVMAPVWLPHFR